MHSPGYYEEGDECSVFQKYFLFSLQFIFLVEFFVLSKELVTTYFFLERLSWRITRWFIAWRGKTVRISTAIRIIGAKSLPSSIING